jgi:hypothetical protein
LSDSAELSHKLIMQCDDNYGRFATVFYRKFFVRRT